MGLMEAVVTLTALVHANTGLDLDRKEAFCMTQNLYHEARNQPEAGIIAVAMVTLRLSEQYDSICDTVFSGKFSWTLNPHPVLEPKAWRDVAEIAVFSMAGFFTVDYSRGADHYYNPAVVSPPWAPKMELVARIEDHDFLLSR